jgi:hypothetical protein
LGVEGVDQGAFGSAWAAEHEAASAVDEGEAYEVDDFAFSHEGGFDAPENAVDMAGLGAKFAHPWSSFSALGNSGERPESSRRSALAM